MTCRFFLVFLCWEGEQIHFLGWRRFTFPPHRRVTFEKAPKVTKPSSWLGPPASGTRTPTTLRGPAPNGHPCPDSALAASMPLDPLRVVYVWPAPKSRLVVSGLARQEDQKQKHLAALLLILAGGRGSKLALGRTRTICRAAVAKSDDSVVPDTPHAQVLLPVPGRSRDKRAPTGWREKERCTNQESEEC